MCHLQEICSISNVIVLSNLIHRIRLLFCKERESYLCFYRILGFYPKHLHYYQQALLHKSTAIRSDKGRLLNNERLEFLGDAILDAVVGDIVYRHFEGRREGFLTNTRSKIVQRETLNKLAVEIGLDKLVKTSNRSQSHNNYLYGNAFEAFIGAIYLDRGYDCCMRFIENKILKQYIDLDKMSRKEMNFKSRLIEWCQKNKMQVSFELIDQMMDKDHSPTFSTEVHIEGIPAGRGTGYSKKESQQKAAQMALKVLKNDETFRSQIEEAYARNHAKPQEEQTLSAEQQNELSEQTEQEVLTEPKKEVVYAEKKAQAEQALPNEEREQADLKEQAVLTEKRVQAEQKVLFLEEREQAAETEGETPAEKEDAAEASL